ncbi:MAG: ATP-binding cassette domain-containing protein [Bdellovibrionaceae bacterium]|nr:ATP-binding cassette domain-containing protein [Pseudobdellovibrionaceae bacterium]
MIQESVQKNEAQSGARVNLSKVNLQFKEKVVIENLNLTLEAGSFTSLLGPSGCGKSSLLRILAGTQPMTSGQLEFMPFRPRLGIVFQDSNLIPWRTVEENLQLPFEIRRESFKNIDEELARVGLLSAKKNYPFQLSGGMKMRVSLARALVDRPEILLLDEPLAALDETTRQLLQEDLRTLWNDSRMTVIFVTHSISEAVFLSDRVVVMNSYSGQNQIIDDRPIDLGEVRTEILRQDPVYLKNCADLSRVLRPLK